MLRESRKNGVSSRTPSEPVSAYRQLTAGEIAAGLHGLSLDELKAVEVYEARHHGRRSVLDAVREARRALVHEHASASF